jgi:hypothetical protein
MQPLIDQGRTVWLWPDRDGIKEWENLREKLGSDKIQIYTAFFDRCYIPEEDGPKADVADIAIRLMGGGRVPEQKTDTGDGQGATENNAPVASDQSGATPAHDPVRIGDIIADIISDDKPFLDSKELSDPRIRMWRETLRQRYNFNKRHKQ